MPIPAYLNKLAVPVSEKGEWTTFSLKCPCGCEDFFLSQNYLTKEEQKQERPYYDALDYLFGSRGSGFGPQVAGLTSRAGNTPGGSYLLTA